MGLMTDARFVGRGDLEDADDAGVAIDLDAGGVGEERRRRERLAAEATDAARRVDGRRRRRLARALTEQQAGTRPPADARSAIVTDDGLAALDAGHAVDELEVGPVGLQEVRGEVEELLADLVRGGDHGPAVVERRLRAAGPAVVRPGVRVLVEDPEFVRAASRGPRRRGSAGP